MPSPGAIKAGRAYVEISADDKRLAEALHGAESRLRRWASDTNRIGERARAAASAQFGLGDVRGIFGRASPLGVLAGGSAILGLTMVLNKLREGSEGFAKSMSDANVSAGEMVQDFIRWLPVIGSGADILKNVGTGIAHWIVGANEFNRELSTAKSKLDEIRRGAEAGTGLANAPDEVARKRLSIEAEFDKQLLAAGNAEVERKRAAKDESLSPSIEYTKAVRAIRERYWAEMTKVDAEQKDKIEREKAQKQKAYDENSAREQKSEAEQQGTAWLDVIRRTEKQKQELEDAIIRQTDEEKEKQLQKDLERMAIGRSNRALRDQATEAKLRLQYKDDEVALERELLDLRERRAIQMAIDNGLDIEAVKARYYWERELLEVSTKAALRMRREREADRYVRWESSGGWGGENLAQRFGSGGFREVVAAVDRMTTRLSRDLYDSRPVLDR